MTLVQFEFRRGTTTEWATINPIPLSGEPCYDSTLGTLRIGNGIDNYLALPTASAASGMFNVRNYGALGDGTTDDTAAFQAAIAAAKAAGGGRVFMPSGEYGLSEDLQFLDPNGPNAVSLSGTGRDSCIIKALGPNAGLSWGDFPTGSGATGVTMYGYPGTSKDFSFDGNGVATQGIRIGTGVAYSTWEAVDVTHVSGDAWKICPQNCTFIQCVGRGSQGHGWVLDYGIQTCTFIQCHGVANDGYGFEIRQSGGPGWGASAQPQDLHFIDGIVEQGGSPYYADTGLGGFHIREGVDITFDRYELVDTAGGGALVLTPSTANGFVGRIVVRDCRISKIYLNANSGGVAQSMGGTNEALYFEGWNVAVGPGVLNGSTAAVYATGLNTIPYATEGTGARSGFTTPIIDNPTLSGTTTINRTVQVPVSTVLATAGAVTLDSAAGSLQEIVAFGDVTSMSVSNPIAGARLTIMLAVASFPITIAWPADFQWQNSTPLPAPVGQWLTLDFVYDAANSKWVQQANYAAGAELGFAESTTTFTTTTVGYPGTAVTGLSVTVVGTGRPVEIEAVLPTVYHSVANTFVGAVILVGGAGFSTLSTYAWAFSTSASIGVPLRVARRAVLAAGVSYTFTVGLFGNAAGTTTSAAGTINPQQLSVIAR